jgi:hypothetical protein
MPIEPSGNSIYAVGSVTSPAGAVTVANTGTIPVGLYLVTVTVYIDGTVVTATDDDNLKISMIIAGINSKVLAVPSNGQVVTYKFVGMINNVTVGTGAAGTAGSIYHAAIVATPYQGG